MNDLSLMFQQPTNILWHEKKFPERFLKKNTEKATVLKIRLKFQIVGFLFPVSLDLIFTQLFQSKFLLRNLKLGYSSFFEIH